MTTGPNSGSVPKLSKLTYQLDHSVGADHFQPSDAQFFYIRRERYGFFERLQNFLALVINAMVVFLRFPWKGA